MISVCPSHDGRHGGEALEAALYCAVCMQSVCYKCAFEKHKDHKITPIQVAAENIRVSTFYVQHLCQIFFQTCWFRLAWLKENEK